MEINFGKKIPIAQCQIQDRTTKNPTSATIYEYDCKDSSDYWDLYRISKEQEWVFADIIATKADDKYNGSYPDERIYALEDKSGKTVGLCNFRENKDKIEVQYIDSKSSRKYKYIGQTMLAFLAQKALYENKKELRINNASTLAFKFYKKCCFKYDWSELSNGQSDFYLKREKLHLLIRKNQKNTKSETLNLYF